MPRPKCPACGAPLEGGFLWTQCDYCDARSGPSVRAWRELAVAMLPFIVGIGLADLIARKDWNHNLPREAISIGLQASIAAAFVLSRHWPSRKRRSSIIELRPAPANHAPVRYIEPSGPSFDPPREWNSILSSPRPRRLSSGPVKSASSLMLIVVLVAGLVGSILFRYHVRIDGVASSLFALFALAWLVYLLVDRLRDIFQSSQLLRNGEVAIGWIADAWETGETERITHVTVKFRDLSGQILARDFRVRTTKFPVDPGHAALAFYDYLKPERFTTLAASSAQLAEEQQPLSAVRVG